MSVIGIVCEYNPLHLGHKKQLDHIRQNHPDSAIVCIMSGNFVQRGHPAIVDKTLRAEAAVRSGADLVLELPVTAALSSAEGFAAEAVRRLSPVCDQLCFGCESADADALMETARALLRPDFSEHLRRELEKGVSFPAARAAALEAMGAESSLLRQPNDILAVEYCKAILAQGSSMTPLSIRRGGSYHALEADASDPSATAVRELMVRSGAWLDYIPQEARDCFRGASIHTLQSGERMILSRLRTMTDGEFEALPYGSEGLWRKLMHESRRQSTLEEILTSVKSKRYTRTRLQRMVMCALLGISREMLDTPAPWTRALAFNDRGRQILKKAREYGLYPNAGEEMDHPYQLLENRAGDLYGLFAETGPEVPGAEKRRRVIYIKENVAFPSEMIKTSPEGTH